MSVSRYIPAASVRRGLPRRKVSDDQIRQAARSRLTSSQASALFGVTSATLNRRAVRLGVSFLTLDRGVWSELDDQIIREVAAKRLSLKVACRQVRVGSAAFKARAKAIGADLNWDKPRCGTLVEGGAIFHDHSEPCLDVGKNDLLLEKLREAHGAPRDDIYPGSEAPVRRLILNPT